MLMIMNNNIWKEICLFKAMDKYRYKILDQNHWERYISRNKKWKIITNKHVIDYLKIYSKQNNYWSKGEQK